ncbi:hypothetical protein HL653_02640 [Sphingomonas sp. AP4-R1]|uniref:hypothetical protein n=1 Tax=Sphingomonas sp. AP4-R1 TaxID=2735134 RepID=UPI00149343DB|nr:hypothetical protein [Sphingomonas sp. AP4-R1]QJU56832.1 hypothetical protein HL653_02640 [Sphingomonas sp. AP4-R1]
MSADRTRIDAILGCAEAKGREAQANHIAFNTNMSLTEARGLLSASGRALSAAEKEEHDLQSTLALVRSAGVPGYRTAP